MLARASGRSPALAAGALTLVLLSPTTLATTERGHASATVLQWIAVTEARPMSFAAVAPPPAGGTIVLSPAGTVSSSAGFAFRGTPAAGSFRAHGLPDLPASVSFSSGDMVTGPGPAMRVGAFTNNAMATFDSAANLTFAVGATLVVNPHQTPGQYSGTYVVTVNF